MKIRQLLNKARQERTREAQRWEALEENEVSLLLLSVAILVTMVVTSTLSWRTGALGLATGLMIVMVFATAFTGMDRSHLLMPLLTATLAAGTAALALAFGEPLWMTMGSGLGACTLIVALVANWTRNH